MLGPHPHGPDSGGLKQGPGVLVQSTLRLQSATRGETNCHRGGPSLSVRILKCVESLKHPFQILLVLGSCSLAPLFEITGVCESLLSLSSPGQNGVTSLPCPIGLTGWRSGIFFAFCHGCHLYHQLITSRLVPEMLLMGVSMCLPQASTVRPSQLLRYPLPIYARCQRDVSSWLHDKEGKRSGPEGAGGGDRCNDC